MKKFAIIFFQFLFVFSATAQETDQKWKKSSSTIQDSLIKVSKNVYMIKPRGAAGNIIVYESKNGFILVDDQSEELGPTITKLINSISDKPILYILNTHFHYDHVDGNKAFGKRGIKIIAHDNLRKRLMADQLISPPTNITQKAYPYEALPYITFSDSLTLHEIEEDIKLFYVKNAHTDTDSFIEFKNENVYHTGDVFVRYGFPFMDENNGGNILGIIKAVDDLIKRTNDSTKIIPGHGPLSSKKDLIVYRDNLQLIVKRIQEGMANNLTANQIEQNNPVQGINWNNQFFVTSQIYNMLKSPPEGLKPR